MSTTCMTFVLLYSVLIETALARSSGGGGGGGASARRDTRVPLDASGKMNAPQQTARGLRGAKSALFDEGHGDLGTEAEVRNSLTEFTTGMCDERNCFVNRHKECSTSDDYGSIRCKTCAVQAGRCVEKSMAFEVRNFRTPTPTRFDPAALPPAGGVLGEGISGRAPGAMQPIPNITLYNNAMNFAPRTLPVSRQSAANGVGSGYAGMPSRYPRYSRRGFGDHWNPNGDKGYVWCCSERIRSCC